MVKQSVKDLLFLVNRFACLPSTWLARVRYRRPARPEGHYVHLGCGGTYVPGMINADGNRFRKVDAWLDLRNRLPFGDGSVRFIWMSHTLEHLFPDDAITLLKEFRRVLKPDGEVRIAVPDFEHALRIVRGEETDVWPRKFDDPLGQAINHLFVDGQHKFAYSFSVLKAFAEQAGFGRVEHYSREHKAAKKRYGAVEVGDEPYGSLVVELRK